ncbi:hypothetical protein [Rhodopirellula bahusiensis]|uniref:Uncharacterized protein n=1 Tax=Rhodopirellula bahusiensis TaxID=2014065 RepID=A0A2G1VY47_9BACT|nr:hypothetical protein [Rhodopirellula bahusiensis]PHQ31661.1 hypothetical protein CEE69_29940 [Rhodopirellula bahusiensis]
MNHDPFDQPATDAASPTVTGPTEYAVGVEDDPAAALINTSAWKKILIGAVVTPVVVAGLVRRFMVRNADKEFEIDIMSIGLLLVLASVVGGLLGGLLAWKDRVEHRVANNLPISFPSKLLFGYGILSLILVWVPIAIFGTIFVLVLTL